jgi:hypothetical protein
MISYYIVGGGCTYILENISIDIICREKKRKRGREKGKCEGKRRKDLRKTKIKG